VASVRHCPAPRLLLLVSGRRPLAILTSSSVTRVSVCQFPC